MRGVPARLGREPGRGRWLPGRPAPDRWPGLMRGGLLGMALVLAACDMTAGKDPGSGVGPQASRAVAGPGAPTARTAGYEDHLKRLDAGIDQGLKLASGTPPDGLAGLEVVSLYLERAQLTGEYENYGQAGALLDRLSRDGKPTGRHCLLRARLNFTLHRLKAAEDALTACHDAPEAAAAAALRGQIAQQAGRYREAEQIFRNLLNASPLSNHFVQLALLRHRTGAPAEAMALLEAAEKRYHGGSRVMIAWLRLQRGLVALESGRFDEALALYLLAEDALPGWWLIEEHRAEVLHLMGRTAESRALYEKVTRQTAAPEFLDALASIERESGNPARASDLHRLARTKHEARIKQFPEAASGHALDHYLSSPDQRTEALALARRNHALRPNGEAAIGLARALLAHQQAAQALSLLKTQQAAGWDTAEMHWVMAHALHQLGKADLAAAALREALARNPQSAKMYGAMAG